MIVNFIKKYTNILYRYNNLVLTTFFWNKSHILSACSVITTTKNKLSESLVDIWVDKNMLFLSCELFLYIIISV